MLSRVVKVPFLSDVLMVLEPAFVFDELTFLGGYKVVRRVTNVTKRIA